MHKAERGRRRKALLVIHGIGKQPPLRALGAFAQGLTAAAHSTHEAGEGARPRPEPAAHAVTVAGRRRTLVRLPACTLDGTELDVFEYHWAEHAVGGMSAAATFGWLLEVAVAGLDFRRQLPFLLAGLPPRRAWPLVLRQLLQVASLAGVAAFLLVAALQLGARSGEAVTALRAAAERLPELPSAPQLVALVLFVCLVAAVLLLGRDLLLARLEAAGVQRAELALTGGGWAGLHAAGAARWTGAGGLVLAASLAATLALGYLLWPVLADYLAAVAALLAEPGVAMAGAALLVGLAGRRLLLTHVADIALYVTSDRVSSRARTRRAILDEGEELLRGLLEAGYDGVYLAGHSLGSVVALDLLDRLARGAAAGDAPELSRLRGLLTFGSPLDKVAYFFRARPREGEAVRAQLLTFLHGVRRRPDLRDHGPYALAEHEQPFEELDWLQVHAPGDLLSDRLVHYRVDRRLVLPLFNPLTAHNAYWRDARFFVGALAWLRGGRCYSGRHEEGNERG